MPNRMKSDDGTIEKTSISNLTVKSKSSRQPETVGPRESSWVHVENRIADGSRFVYSWIAKISSPSPKGLATLNIGSSRAAKGWR